MYERNDVIRQFEDTIAKHCGSRYAVAVESCTAALLLCCIYLKVEEVTIPCHTYFSVPHVIKHAGGTVKYEPVEWSGAYKLKPYPIIDSAVQFRRNMYEAGTFRCLSFHYSKHIPIGRGGMILTDLEHAAEWFRTMRNDGRREIPKEQDLVTQVGWNFYMNPEQAARGLSLYYWRIAGKPDPADIDMGYENISYLG